MKTSGEKVNVKSRSISAKMKALEYGGPGKIELKTR